MAVQLCPQCGDTMMDYSDVSSDITCNVCVGAITPSAHADEIRSWVEMDRDIARATLRSFGDVDAWVDRTATDMAEEGIQARVSVVLAIANELWAEIAQEAEEQWASDVADDGGTL